MNVHAARLMTRALAVLGGLLLLLLLAQYAGMGRGYHWTGSDSTSEPDLLGKVDQRPIELPPESAFADIAAHPLFNSDRLPSPIDEGADTAGGEDLPPPSPLNVALTGVIVDDVNQVHIAMLQDKASNQSLALRVGMPLEGDQASWTLVEVKPRAAVFRNSADETAEVELETALAPMAGPRRPPARPGAGRPGAARPQPGRAGAARPPPARPAAATQAATQQSAAARQGAAASDLAQRIEERRRQMREEADKMRRDKERQPDSNRN